MTPRDLIARFRGMIHSAQAMRDVARLTQFDRYQASLGIESAAAFVAERARACGLADVRIERFPADGDARWWSFHAPVAWTPLIARLEIDDTLVVDHATQPFSVATYSAPTPDDGIETKLVEPAEDADLSGAIAVIDAAQFARSTLAVDLHRRGAIGFVTDASARHDAAGRIELDPHSPLFAFSVTSSQLDCVRSAMRGRRVTARATIRVDGSASMPVVTGVLPGSRDEREVWLIGHLCHPRPGANDNASGVAALLGVAAALSPCHRTIRFLWGPEYLGTVAILHRSRQPYAVINVDMAGEDQQHCASPFVVERMPETRISLAVPIAEAIVREVFAQTSGDDGTWSAVPFLGFSDHALFANICDAIQFCHPADRFNHTSADTLDKVSEREMLRTMTASAALAEVFANDNALSASALERVLADWCTSEIASAAAAAEHHSAVENGRWSTRLVEHVARVNAEFLSLLHPPAVAVPPRAACVVRRREAPINLRAMLANAPIGVRTAVNDLIRADKRHYALLLNFAIRAGRGMEADEIIEATSMAWRQPINHSVARLLFEALVSSEWIALHEEP